MLVWMHFLFSILKIEISNNFYIKYNDSYIKSMNLHYVLKNYFLNLISIKIF